MKLNQETRKKMHDDRLAIDISKQYLDSYLKNLRTEIIDILMEVGIQAGPKILEGLVLTTDVRCSVDEQVRSIEFKLHLDIPNEEDAKLFIQEFSNKSHMQIGENNDKT